MPGVLFIAIMTVLHVGILFYGVIIGIPIKLTISVLVLIMLHLMPMPDAQTTGIMWVKVVSSRMLIMLATAPLARLNYNPLIPTSATMALRWVYMEAFSRGTKFHLRQL